MRRSTKITVSQDGPYLVSDSVPLSLQTIGVNADGESTEWIQGDALPSSRDYALCRCGASKTKPFCDGSRCRSDN